MKGLRRKGSAVNEDIKKLPLISSEIVLSPSEVAQGCTVVDVPLTLSDRERLDNSMARTGEDVGYVVRDALRVLDILSEEEAVQGNELLTRDSITRKILPHQFWPKKRVG